MGTSFVVSGLTKRMAYKMLNIVGENTNFILLGTFIIIAGMTLLMAHTAVAAAIFPLLVAIHSLYSESDQPTRFGKGMFIGMAWTAGAGSVITFLGVGPGGGRGPACLRNLPAALTSASLNSPGTCSPWG